jgi:hypothetical protein
MSVSTELPMMVLWVKTVALAPRRFLGFLS